MHLVEQMAPARLGRHEKGRGVKRRVIRALPGLLLGAPQRPLLAQNAFTLLLEGIGTALEEQQAKDVFLELRGIHLAAQDVGGREQMPFQFWECELGQGSVAFKKRLVSSACFVRTATLSKQ
ncbi:hypothetical protein Thiowin_02977 [Thiorhodovibrio winogradskyi]|uniref:Uncharacterized protein n=1 Tax=Thiorhodovibrio winogradskyi TaxID=77007 RepID=A0ABZ0SBM7_9GAMM|nr:hypothetical protein [Thiorhodovibrio winogradskyi]